MTDSGDSNLIVGRGDFLEQLAALVATMPLGRLAETPPVAQPHEAANAMAARSDNLVGIQMGAHTMLDEGIEHAFDLCQQTASIDTAFTYCCSYGGDVHKPLASLATDHGAPVIDQRTRKLPNVWVRQHEQYWRNTALRHPKPGEDEDLSRDRIQSPAGRHAAQRADGRPGDDLSMRHEGLQSRGERIVIGRGGKRKRQQANRAWIIINL